MAQRRAVVAKPVRERMVSRTVQVCRVCLTVMLKYLATIQKPPSLTWLRMMEPAQMAMAMRASSIWE